MCPEWDSILVPVGGGGLITGVSLAAKAMHPVKVIGVQTEACPAMLKALEDKTFYEDYPSKPSICDAVVGGVGEIGYTYAEKCIDRVVTASEDAVREAMVELLRKDKVVREPSGRPGVAYPLGAPRRVHRHERRRGRVWRQRRLRAAARHARGVHREAERAGPAADLGVHLPAT